MKLIPVDPANESHLHVLYGLLEERDPSASISHKKMPTWQEHVAFVKRVLDQEKINPDAYMGWDLIEVDGQTVGAVYVTERYEIGISIFKKYQGKGYGSAAVKKVAFDLMPGRVLANIAPTNTASRRMFEKLGFKTIQHTLALEVE